MARFESQAEQGSEGEHILRLCEDASVEMTVHDLASLCLVRGLLPQGSNIYISHLPKQAWEETIETARLVRQEGWEPVPHLPVRKLKSETELKMLLLRLSAEARVRHVLLIGGDIPAPAGPYSAAIEVLRTELLNKHAIDRVSLAAYPEGHPKIEDSDLRVIEEAKVRCAQELGLRSSLVTQFCFESEPIVRWARATRLRGISSEIQIGLAGPARPTTLLRYAMRCGIGPSMRALSTAPGAFGKLLSEAGPERLVRELSQARSQEPGIFDRIHLFSFGGLARTVRWIHSVQEGRFTLEGERSFRVQVDS